MRTHRAPGLQGSALVLMLCHNHFELNLEQEPPHFHIALGPADHVVLCAGIEEIPLSDEAGSGIWLVNVKR